MIISLIVAMDERGGIGKNNRLPWRLPSDLKRFKALTMGHHLVMGRKTYETIGRPLQGRVMIILTRKKDYAPQGCILKHSLEEAIKDAEGTQETELFIIGGGEIFQQAFSLAEKIYLTRVHAIVDADVFFPIIDHDCWECSNRESQAKTGNEEFASDFVILTRKH